MRRLRMFLKIVLWGGLFVMGMGVLGVIALFIYGWMENAHYNNLTDTHDLGKRAEEMAAPYIAKREHVRLAVGISQHGKRFVKIYGKDQDPPPDPIYEIGSITKTFTGIMLAHLANEGTVRLDQPLSELLPDVSFAEGAGTITLKELATHTSGLPRLPANLKVTSEDPYASYRASDIYADLSVVKLRSTRGKSSEYSNYGVGLLGHVLSVRSGKSYGELLDEVVCGPLDMSSTAVTLPAELEARFVDGHAPGGDVARHWTFDVLSGAGAIRSDLPDMLAFLEANIRTPDDSLGKAMKLAQEVHFNSWMGHQGLGWQIKDDPYIKTRIHWHNGGTAGFVSFVGFIKSEQIAVALFSNYGDAFAGDSSVDEMGMRLLRYATKVSLE